jgi:chemotaxis protein MotB
MSDQPIIIKKVKKVNAHAHHGGSWKIAYADFVTAMMAFFLLMWLIGSVGQSDKDGIADFFKMPLKAALQGGPAVANSSSLVKGGGVDLERKTGESSSRYKQNASQAQIQSAGDPLVQLGKNIEKNLEKESELSEYKDQIKIQLIPEGLRVLLIDKSNRPMFQLGNYNLLPHTQKILRKIADDIKNTPNFISISGHTDALTYPKGQKSYSNWELSADRANAARRILVQSGLPSDRIFRVVGSADSDLLNRQQPASAENRRIEIVILNQKEAERLKAK